jgi:hypothetical protein
VFKVSLRKYPEHHNNLKHTRATHHAKLDDAEAKLRQVEGKGIEPVIKEIKHALSKN